MSGALSKRQQARNERTLQEIMCARIAKQEIQVRHIDVDVED
jgi:hypothetical protein